MVPTSWFLPAGLPLWRSRVAGDNLGQVRVFVHEFSRIFFHVRGDADCIPVGARTTVTCARADHDAIALCDQCLCPLAWSTHPMQQAWGLRAKCMGTPTPLTELAHKKDALIL